MLRTAVVSVLAVVGPALVCPGGTVTKVTLLNGDQVPPGVSTDARGCARFVVDTDANQVAYHISFSGLSSAETVAHIHGPAPIGGTAGPMFTLPAGNPKVGVWNYGEGQEAAILDGLTYVNIHSANHPAGEIRGQIVDLVASIDGAQEVPPVASGGTGYGLFQIDPCLNELSYHIVFDALGAPESNAHIHGFALHGTGAGVVHPLPAGSPKVGAWAYPGDLEPLIRDGLTYVNIHSDDHPGGEIRGQITSIVSPLDHAQEVPPTNEVGHGCGYVAVDRAADQLSFYLTYQDLTGPASAAHIHGFAPPGAGAGVLFGIGTANPAVAAWTYGAADEDDVLDGLTYFNVHTSAHSGGEIRGQIEMPAPPCIGDANCDGGVDVLDLVAVITAWGTADPGADLDGDGAVGVPDLILVIVNWGPCP